MVYVIEDFSGCTPGWIEQRIAALPPWRREKVLALKKPEDRLRSLLAFLLLAYGLKKEFGIDQVPEFAYTQWGKPCFGNLPVQFSLSHCQSAVACALGSCPVGVDVQDKMAFSSRLAEKIGSSEEVALLNRAEDRDWALTALWTKKEALAKKNGKGLGAHFPLLQGEVFTLHRPNYCLSVTEEDPQIDFIEEL